MSTEVGIVIHKAHGFSLSKRTNTSVPLQFSSLGSGSTSLTRYFFDHYAFMIVLQVFNVCGGAPSPGERGGGERSCVRTMQQQPLYRLSLEVFSKTRIVQQLPIT